MAAVGRFGAEKKERVQVRRRTVTVRLPALDETKPHHVQALMSLPLTHRGEKQGEGGKTALPATHCPLLTDLPPVWCCGGTSMPVQRNGSLYQVGYPGGELAAQLATSENTIITSNVTQRRDYNLYKVNRGGGQRSATERTTGREPGLRTVGPVTVDKACYLQTQGSRPADHASVTMINRMGILKPHEGDNYRPASQRIQVFQSPPWSQVYKITHLGKQTLLQTLSLRDAVRQVTLLQAATRRFIHAAEEARGSSFWGDVEVSGFKSEEPAYEEQVRGETYVPSRKKKEKEKLALAFDSNFFKTQYEFTFPEKAIEVTLRRPEERSEQDIRFIRSMMMGILGFRRYSTQMQHMLARVVYYRRFGRGRVIVRKGHRGDSFYFVFSGVIAVTQDEDGSSALLDPEPILLHKGASFGEVALLKGLRRNATVVCMEDTEFLVVDRKEFFRNKLDQELQKELQYRFRFFRSLDLFSTWSDERLEKLADHCKTEECHHSQVIIGDTHQTKNIIFVTKGRCEVLHLVDLSGCPSFHKWIKQHEALLGRKSMTSYCSFLFMAEKTESNSSVNGAPSSAIKEATDVLPERSVYSVADLAGGYGRPTSCSEGPGNLNLPRELMAAVYLRIDSLQPGQHFRGVDVEYIEACFEKKGHLLPDLVLPLSHDNETCLSHSLIRDPRSMVIVSQGSEVIRIKLDKFSELADLATLKKLRERIVPYPSDNDLCRIFLEQNRWKIFKSDLVNQLSSSPRLHPKHYRHQETGRAGHKGQSADKRGILQLGTHKAKAEKFWTTPPKSKASECSDDREEPEGSAALVRLIHAIDIPKLCGKRIMW
ncbi:PREDICTED: cyclic nucleotide-binding domain-containing protein 2-like [Nanorana parkeri]|uniref:cyclic nucleotide-binding domain-containing protein 2-like n=1 Tax=Nanorana parkeri TaxID=125878 RepID=UPI000854BCE3|nr:PREDICTED: cyclic nucleotide-binding domain-containing protein 2-like [Nanorana parkeri]